jgi:integrase
MEKTGATGRIWLRPGHLFLSRYKKPYSTNGLLQMVYRACDAAGVDRWSPNQLRHAETARVILGHSDVSTTEIYAERDHAAAMRAVARVG